MFDSITDKISGAFRVLAGKAKISEANIEEAIREVRMALLEADVNLQVARGFIDRVKEAALGEKVLGAVDPGEQFISIVNDELINLLGGEFADIQWAPHGTPTVIMLCGLQGAGKTSTCGKLAMQFLKDKRRPLLVAADLQRPAAVEQLKVLGKQIGVNVYSDVASDPVRVCQQALEIAKLQNADTIILDTAGRLHVDAVLMSELENIVKATQPAEVLFVCDAMIGQSAVDTAKEFKARLPLTGAIMTKLDSDARGGAALSLREVTGVPIKYVAVGEKLEDLEAFHPDRMAGRILGMGDVVSLVEKAQQMVDEKEAVALKERLEGNTFDLDDFRKQLKQIRKMGGMKDMLGMLPGMGQALKNVDIDEKEFSQLETIIQSMTPDERKNPEILSVERRWRIARGAGCMEGLKGSRKATVKPVNDLLKQFGEMKKMVGKMSKRGLFSGGMDALSGLLSGGPSAMMGGSGGFMGGSKKSGGKAQQKKKDRKKRKKKRR